MHEKEVVLVVEDDQLIREAVAELFSAFGCVVLQAEDGAKGAEVFRANPAVRLVLSDFHMPRQNGIELYWAIEADLASRRAVFILVTGSDVHDPRLITFCHQSSVKCYGKPFGADIVEQIIDQVFHS